MHHPYIDPHMRAAQKTDFIDYRSASASLSSISIGIMLELRNSDGIDAHSQLQQFASRRKNIILQSSHAAAHSAVVTAFASPNDISALAEQSFLASIELAQPLRPKRPTWVRPTHLPTSTSKFDPKNLVKSIYSKKSKTLAALIDHGCPFAHTEFLRTDKTTRVITLWDQDEHPDFNDAALKPPAGFSYGQVVPQSALQHWINQSKTVTGAIDEQACYAASGYTALEGDLTHGSHVLGRFVGRSYTENYAPTSADLAAESDIAFVQFPRQALATPSSGAMHRYILDGLRYLRDFAHSQGYERCIVVCDYGTYLGPHDGSSLFERALNHFLDENKFKGATQFQVVLPAGNCNQQALHTVVKPKKNKPAQVSWNLPAFNECPNFAELWFNATDAECLQSIELQFDNHTKEIALPKSKVGSLTDSINGIVFCLSRSQNGQAVLTLRAAPTHALARSTAAGSLQSPGALTMSLTLNQACSEQGVHGYICWGGTPISFEPRMRQAYWSVPKGEGQTEITSGGCLLGSGCGSHKDLFLIGSYVQNTVTALRKPSDYSSTGPSRGTRHGPDFLAPADKNNATKGIVGPGTRSGIVRSMWGTSAAAPLAARAILNGKPTISAAVPGQSVSEAGKGYLDYAV